MKMIATLLCSIGLMAGPTVVTTEKIKPGHTVQNQQVVQYGAAAGNKDVYLDVEERRKMEEGRKEDLRRRAIEGVVFRHGDISWLPLLAAEAGWPEKTWEKLGQIILRESGGCPNRRGGDAVDKDCNITKVTEWNHRSDTGLLQINGVNYDMSRNKWAAVCLELSICSQEPLLDPITNLRAGKLLYDMSGWGPWDPCTWDKTRCSKKKK